MPIKQNFHSFVLSKYSICWIWLTKNSLGVAFLNICHKNGHRFVFCCRRKQFIILEDKNIVTFFCQIHLFLNYLMISMQLQMESKITIMCIKLCFEYTCSIFYFFFFLFMYLMSPKNMNDEVTIKRNCLDLCMRRILLFVRFLYMIR